MRNVLFAETARKLLFVQIVGLVVLLVLAWVAVDDASAGLPTGWLLLAGGGDWGG